MSFYIDKATLASDVTRWAQGQDIKLWAQSWERTQIATFEDIDKFVALAEKYAAEINARYRRGARVEVRVSHGALDTFVGFHAVVRGQNTLIAQLQVKCFRSLFGGKGGEA